MNEAPAYCQRKDLYPQCRFVDSKGVGHLCPEVDTCQRYQNVTDIFGTEYYRTHKQTPTRFQKDTSTLQQKISEICRPYCPIQKQDPTSAPAPEGCAHPELFPNCQICPEADTCTLRENNKQKESVICDKVRNMLERFLERDSLPPSKRITIDELPEPLKKALPPEITVLFTLGRIGKNDLIPTHELEKIVKSMDAHWTECPLYMKLYILFGHLTSQKMQNIRNKIIKEAKEQKIQALNLPTDEQIISQVLKTKMEEVIKT